MTSQRLTAKLLALVLFFAALFTAVGAQPASAVPYHCGPSLAVSTSTPVAGTTITITGSCWTTGVRVTLSLNVGTTTYALGSVGTGLKGNFTFNATIPAGTSGPATIVGLDSQGHTASVNITIISPPPILSLSSSTVSAGATVTVTGSQYAHNESVAITLSINSTIYNLATVSSTNSTGTFSTNVVIPVTASGNGVVTGKGSTNDTASAPINVVAPSIALSRNPVVAGTTVQVTGTNFAKNETVNLTLKFTSKSYALGSASTNGNGSFSKIVTIPANIKGTGQVIATGAQGDTASTSITVTSNSIFAQSVSKITDLTGRSAIGMYLVAALALGSLFGGAFLFRSRRS